MIHVFSASSARAAARCSAAAAAATANAVSACLVNHSDEKRKKNEPSHTHRIFTVRNFTVDFSALPPQLEKSLDSELRVTTHQLTQRSHIEKGLICTSQRTEVHQSIGSRKNRTAQWRRAVRRLHWGALLQLPRASDMRSFEAANAA